MVAPAPAPEPVTPPPLQPPPVVPVVAAPVVPVTPVATPVLVTAPSSSVDAALVRIRDIKAAVNQKVGNPVNLVDINNAVGREYMVAMLEAMKRVAGNTPGDLGAAMARLETAYAAVEAAIAAHGTAAVSTPTPTAPMPEVAKVPVVAPVATPAPVVAETPASAPTPPVAPEPVYVPPVAPVMPPPVVATPPPPAPAPAPEASRYAAMAAEPVAVPPVQTGFRAASLADDPVALRTPQDLPDPASLASSSVSGDPLFTREVDAGLEQLLSEWVIFKKSGLFGTGPRGREHPLFKALASLSIPIILAGRYDGATPEIRQSITDYMNGWRYEQGIIYEQDETFEHYLRRVIHHIIDLQKRRRQA